MFQLLAATIVTALGAGNLCAVSGAVVDGSGQPVSGAAVYLEQGLEGGVVTARSAADGSYRFDEVYPGVVGVFAHGPGRAWGGASVSLGSGQALSGVTLRLRALGSLSGHVSAGKAKAVEGVRITRVALLTESPVSIPYSKLRAFGVEEPVTDSSGRYTIDSLPLGATVAVKLSHPSYAQARIDEAKVGSRDADVTLYEGVLVTGQVLASGTDRAVAQAAVSIRNANPPHDTAIAISDVEGNFGLRMLPGAYLYKAGGARFESGGWQSLLLTGESPIQQLTLHVAGTGEVSGKVLDAKTSEPIAGARIYLETGGAPAAMARSGPDGEFALIAMAGENTLRLEAAPGYLPPTTPATRFTVAEGEQIELPAFWLAPLPRYTLRVVDFSGEAAPGAVIRLLRPAQIGWQRTDGTGTVELSFLNSPADGRVVGLVEHATRAEAAVFSISQANSGEAVVQLLPAAELTGRVVDAEGEPLEGAVVDGRLLDESFADPILLWRTVTDAAGEYSAPLVPAQVGQIIVAYTVDEWGGMAAANAAAQSAPRTAVVAPDETKRMDDLSVDTRESGRSLMGKRLNWANGRHLCGPETPEGRESRPAVVMYCSAAEAESTISSLDFAAEFYGESFRYGVVVDGEAACGAQRVHVVTGKSTGTASAFVLNAAGEVVLETFGLPPLKSVRAH